MDNVLWLTASHHTIGGKDLSGSNPHRNLPISSQRAFRDLPLHNLTQPEKFCHVCAAAFNTRRKKSKGAADTILTVLLITLHTVKSFVGLSHTYKSRQISPSDERLDCDLQVLGNTDKLKRLSESDTRVATVSYDGAKKRKPRTGMAQQTYKWTSWLEFPAYQDIGILTQSPDDYLFAQSQGKQHSSGESCRNILL